MHHYICNLFTLQTSIFKRFPRKTIAAATGRVSPAVPVRYPEWALSWMSSWMLTNPFYPRGGDPNFQVRCISYGTGCA